MENKQPNIRPGKAGYAILATMLLGSLLSSAHARPYEPPTLTNGEQYQLAFLTRSLRRGDEKSVDAYNQFVQQEAALNPTLTGTDVGVLWKAVVSSVDGTDAKDNAPVTHPVYRLDGQRIDDGQHPFYSRNHQNDINVDQFGTLRNATVEDVWSGSNNDGTGTVYPGLDARLGSNTTVQVGRTNQGPQWWLHFNRVMHLAYRSLYALSPVLVKGAPILHLTNKLQKSGSSSATETDWILTADGQGLTTVSGAGDVTAFADRGTYNLSQSTTVTGFTNTLIECDDNPGTAVTTVTLDWGDEKTCTFTNIENGEIQIKKVTAPGGGTGFGFAHNIDASSSFTLDDGQTRVFSDVIADGQSYQVIEDAPTGDYKLSGLSCADTDSTVDTATRTANIKVSPGETVVCTFTNTEDDIVTIEKTTIPAGKFGPFAFLENLTGPGTSGFFLQNGGDSKSFTGVSPGSYTVSEVDPGPEGFDLTAIDCHDTATGQTFSGDLATGSVDLSLTAGERVHCTFTNTQRGKIIVRKKTDPVNFPHPFGFDLTGGPDNVDESFSLAGGASHEIDNLKPGNYRISETAVSGWDLSRAKCDDGSNPLKKIKLSPGETVTCTFTNVKRAKLTVVKNAIGNPDTAFDFYAIPSLPGGDFTLKNGESKSLEVPAGSYNLQELNPIDWVLDSATCDNGDSPEKLTLAPGDDVTCTFNNTEQALLRIVKESYGGDGVFEFNSDLPGHPTFSILTGGSSGSSKPGTGSVSFGAFTPGNYVINETVPSGWTLDSATCDNGSTLPNLQLAAGEDVTCTFTNTKLGEIQIKKATHPANGTGFGFTDDIEAPNSFHLNDRGTKVFINVQPGIYKVSEDDPSASGFELSGLSCADTDSTTDVGTRTAEIHVDAGETVVCTFTNTEDDTVVIEKVTLPHGAAGSFTFSQDLDGLGDFTLGDGQSQAFSNVSPGSYTVSEADPLPGFKVTKIECTDKKGGNFPVDLVSRTATLDMIPGDSVHCTFFNTQVVSSLSLKKSASSMTYSLLNELVTYTFTIENTGNETLSTVKVSDPLPGLGSIDCAGSGSDTLASLIPGQKATCTADYHITQADLDAGHVTSKASVAAKDPYGRNITAESGLTILHRNQACFDGPLTIPDGEVFDSDTTLVSTVSIDTESPATSGVTVTAPYTLRLLAPKVEFNPLFKTEGDADPQTPPGGAQLRVIIGKVVCPPTP
ncbi:prealbumin-like fold domain-containing protein [Thiolapillus sp.]